jgi:hypothetical protein
LRGMRERGTPIKAKLVVWSEVDEGNGSGTARSCQRRLHDDRKPSWLLRKFVPKA